MEFWCFIKDYIDVIIGISTVTIALGALRFSYIQSKITRKQGELNREHNEKMITPFIGINCDILKDENVYRLSIRNNGIGPAIIDEITVTLKNKEFVNPSTQDWHNVLMQVGFPKFKSTSFMSAIDPGYYISANQELVLMKIDFFDNTIDYPKLQFRINSFDVRIDYSSIYGVQDYQTYHKSFEN